MWELINNWIDNHFETFIYVAILATMVIGYLAMVAEVAVKHTWKQSKIRVKLMAWCDKQLQK